jgi:lipid kinase YegS
MPKHLDLVVHGARADAPGLREAVADLRSAGHAVRVHVTWERGDAERLAAAAARGASPPDAVVAVGGDGTLNEVANALADTGVPLGLIPLGTANDFARQAGIPTEPGPALELVLTSTPVRLDLGELNGRAFVNVSSAGFGAELTAETGTAAKERLGAIAYALAGVKRLVGDNPVRRAHFTGPDFAVELEYLVFAIGNARATGAGVVITPLASARDGLLDLCVVGPVGRSAFAPLLLDVKRGEHLEREGVHYVQTPWLRVEAEEPVPVNVDGEPGEHRVLDYRVRPGALLAHVARVPGEEEEGEKG